MAKSKSTALHERCTGELDRYVIHVAPEYANFKFVVQTLSEDWQTLKKEEANGEIQFRFPKSHNPRAFMGMTKEMYREMLCSFKLEGGVGVFTPSMDDPELAKTLARAAYEAAIELGPHPDRLSPADRKYPVAWISKRGKDPYEGEKKLPQRSPLKLRAIARDTNDLNEAIPDLFDVEHEGDSPVVAYR